ncbi:hypothetical protein [Nocardia wallacei]|uniref:hypothetical protein n=1 Tax=Nocardia wallacei TaxID=480035 RepID=UPI0024545995|nr:hypothetical protein [Nocardia wallacei]
MTADRDLISEGREKLAAATPGPWFAWDRGVGYMLALDPNGDVVLPEGSRTDLGRREDAEAIAWMRNNLPEILKRWESDARLLRHWEWLGGQVGELLGTDDDEAILPRLRKALEGPDAE